MEFVQQFFSVYWHYCLELWWILAIGFFLSGLIYQFIPTDSVQNILGKPGWKSLFIASSVGIILPVCCLGSLPIALTLRKKGASLGSVLAFLVATPATSISALFVCWKLLGVEFTAAIFISVVVIAVVMGIAADHFRISESANTAGKDDCCHHEAAPTDSSNTVSQKLKRGLKYGFVTLPKEIGFEILIGIAIASFITVFEPLQHFIQSYLTGVVGYLAVLFVGLLTYVCSTASVPLADAFIQSGMSQGQALCFLIVGPVTSYGTILVIRKDFGTKVLIAYLTIICILAIICGMIFDTFLLT